MQTALFNCLKCHRKERGECTDEIFRTGKFLCTFCRSKIITTQDEARQLAIDWQFIMSHENLSYFELAEYQNCFNDLALRFDLKSEFQENGII